MLSCWVNYFWTMLIISAKSGSHQTACRAHLGVRNYGATPYTDPSRSIAFISMATMEILSKLKSETFLSDPKTTNLYYTGTYADENLTQRK